MPDLSSQDDSLEVDVLIVGSGPVGATFARVLHDRAAFSSIAMVDLGPHLGDRAGIHVRNISDPDARARAQILSQGPTRYRFDKPSLVERMADGGHFIRTATLARPGTHLIGIPGKGQEELDMPAAAASSNVGGMGSHWTCACPRPADSEKIPFFNEEMFEAMYAKAEEMLQVSTLVYPESRLGSAIEGRLTEAFANHPMSRPICRMPLACHSGTDGKFQWVGPETILGELARGAVTRFTLLAETLCRNVTYQGELATGAIVEHLPTGRRTVVRAKVVILAADSIRTPQILWASGIRPLALGHYLNDQPQLLCAVKFDVALAEAATEARIDAEASAEKSRPQMDAVVGLFWVPYCDGAHPFHGQVMHFDLSPVALASEGAQADANSAQDHFIGLGWFCGKDLRYEDCLLFSDSEVDHLGMPQIRIHYNLTERDHQNIEAAKQEQLRVAAQLGSIRDGFEPKLLPAGSSLHYQGSVRMGEDPQVSVCDANSQVWGFTNLFVGGNGVIPTAMACNPTLTACALAIQSCDRILALLG